MGKEKGGEGKISVEELKIHGRAALTREDLAAVRLDRQRYFYGVYAGILVETGEVEIEIIPTPEISTTSLHIPEAYDAQCIAVTKKIFGLFDPRKLHEHVPQSQDELFAFYALAYNELKRRDRITPEDEKSFVALLYCASTDTSDFGEGLKLGVASTTYEYTADFLQEQRETGQKTSQDHMNLTYGLLQRMSPLASQVQYAYDGKGSRIMRSAHLKEDEEKLLELLSQVDREVTEYQYYLLGWIERMYPEKVVPPGSQRPTVYVTEITTVPFGSTVDEVIKMQRYYTLHPAGTSNGVDPLTGLTVTVSKTPPLNAERNTDRWEAEVIERARVGIHESIHDMQAKRKLDTYVDTVVNEMLTDTLAEIVQYKTKGLSPYDREKRLNGSTTGYFMLVKACISLIDEGILTEDELMRFAVDQNPRGFLGHIWTKCRDDREKAEKTLRILMRNDLLPSVRLEELAHNVTEFMKDPQYYFQERFEGMIRTRGYDLPSWKTRFVTFLQANEPAIWAQICEDYRKAKGLSEKETESIYPTLILQNPNQKLYWDAVIEVMDTFFKREDEKAYASRGVFYSSDILDTAISQGFVTLPEVYAPGEIDKAVARNTDILLCMDDFLCANLEYFMRPREIDSYFKDALMPVFEQVMGFYYEVVDNFYASLPQEERKRLVVRAITHLNHFPPGIYATTGKSIEEVVERAKSLGVILLSPRNYPGDVENVPHSDFYYEQFLSTRSFSESDIVVSRSIYSDRIRKAST